MKIPTLISLFLPSILLLLPSPSNSQSTYTCSRATYYGSPECTGTAAGACGYGEFGRNLNGGDVGAVARLYRNGTGCGACYQVRCVDRRLCKEGGVKIVVTDHGEGDGTDFIMSARGFVKLARAGLAAELMAYGVVDVEYRRISCEYPGYNMMLQVKEQSSYPDYLAVVVIYQAGKKDVAAVELRQADGQEWTGMRRAYGGVWDIVSPPKGPITVRILTEGENGGQKWVEMNGAIPYDWKAGTTYDSAYQLD